MGKYRLIALVLAGSVLAGCSAVDRLTGQTDNKVLPGQREDAIPGKAQFPEPGSDTIARSPSGDASAPDTAAPPVATECPSDDPACAPASDGTFSGPQ